MPTPNHNWLDRASKYICLQNVFLNLLEEGKATSNDALQENTECSCI